LKLPKTNPLDGVAVKKTNEIFKNTVKRIDGESIVEIPLAELHAPEFHPFQVNHDEAMNRLAENIKQYGVREPGLARPRPDGGYELLCGNRRKMACEIAGIPTLPVIIRSLDSNSAALAMVDSSLEQREKLLYSEKAYAYKVKMEALNHNGVKDEMHSVEVLTKQTGDSKNTIFRLIRLTELVNGLLDRVDANKLGLTSAVELSYLSVMEQTAVLEAMDKYVIKPSHAQAVRLKKLKLSNELSIEQIDEILSKNKKQPLKREPSSILRFREHFPPDYSEEQMGAVIVELLIDWRARVAV
jgi:ParB family chromosome partitioning protein